MKTVSLVQSWRSPSSFLVKKRSHFAFAEVAQGSKVKGNSKESALNNHCGVGHSSVAEENRAFQLELDMPDSVQVRSSIASEQ
jgi:hypothetical protein